MLDIESNISVPGSISRYLREYQREGIKFLYERWKEGRGGVLGDDMGLGMPPF
jgi:DNA excision repair protein ERCC-6-like 2